MRWFVRLWVPFWGVCRLLIRRGGDRGVGIGLWYAVFMRVLEGDVTDALIDLCEVLNGLVAGEALCVA